MEITMAAKKKAAKKKAAGTKALVTRKSAGIGVFIKEQIKAGKSNADIAEATKMKFPDAKTTAASVSWYRGKKAASA
jgi:urease gamma subunit